MNLGIKQNPLKFGGFCCLWAIWVLFDFIQDKLLLTSLRISPASLGTKETEHFCESFLLWSHLILLSHRILGDNGNNGGGINELVKIIN